MKTEPIVAASVSLSNEGVPFNAAFDDVYHPQAGALAQAQHVFLAGNELPARWQGRERFVILETGFGLGNNFLAAWDAWRADAKRSEHLVFVSVEKHPLRREDLTAVHRPPVIAHLATQLVDAWPALTPNLHRLAFEEGRVELLLALGDISAWLPELVLHADAFFLDGFAPIKNPRMWEPRLFKALARLAAPGATAATWTSAGEVRRGLASAGFEVRRAPGIGGKRDITLARFAPRFTPRLAPSRFHAPVGKQRRVVIVGAGLAGCATAAALARQGWRCTLLDRQPMPAGEASGNIAGLFHGIVNAQDGTHARFNRAAAFHASHAIAGLLKEQPHAGSAQGLLRLETTLADVAAMQAMLARVGLPPGYAAALSAAEASARCRLTLPHPAWFYPAGGWVDPAALARHFLAIAGTQAEFRGSERVERLQRTTASWQLLDSQDGLIDEAEIVVLANAADALRLAGPTGWPIETVRGQISMRPALPADALPRLPLAGAGYLLPEVNGWMVFGATSQPGDADATVRPEDHAVNLAQLARLTGRPVEDIVARGWQGRVGWRCVARDRLPLIGAMPELGIAAAGRPLDQPRFVPRQPGLFIFSALGSRGITWSALGGEVMASLISGAPSPLEASLIDAIDPARFAARAARHAPSVFQA